MHETSIGPADIKDAFVTENWTLTLCPEESRENVGLFFSLFFSNLALWPFFFKIRQEKDLENIWGALMFLKFLKGGQLSLKGFLLRWNPLDIPHFLLNVTLIRSFFFWNRKSVNEQQIYVDVCSGRINLLRCGAVMLWRSVNGRLKKPLLRPSQQESHNRLIRCFHISSQQIMLTGGLLNLCSVLSKNINGEKGQRQSNKNTFGRLHYMPNNKRQIIMLWIIFL